MQKSVRTVLLMMAMTLWAWPHASAMQEDVKARVFKDVDDAFTNARAEQADLLSPNVYQQAVKKHEQALKNFDRGKSPEALNNQTLYLLRTAVENAKLARVTFPHTLAARKDALRARAPQLAMELYSKAEKQLTEAAETIEKGDLKKAKERALRSEKKFREAELTAIKLNILGDATQQLLTAKKGDIPKLAPQSFARAVKLLDQAEEVLDRDRSALSEAQALVEDAVYEIRHAAYITKRTKELKDDDANWERLILEHEKYVTDVVNEFQYEPQFDKGMERVTASLVTAISSLKQENRRLNDDLNELAKQNEALQDELHQVRSELNASREVQAGLKATIDSKKQQEEKYKRVMALFLPGEAKCLRIGDELTIRLVGLHFRSGRAIIQPEYFNLLAKVQRAIRIFPDYHVVVEGHTDAVGNDRYNRKLSKARAEAVRAYILASMGLQESKVTAVGYGESRPIATNETQIGRQQNRRIDIVLKPTKE